MDQNSLIKEYFTKMAQIQERVLNFLDNEEKNDQNFKNLIDFLKDQKNLEDANDLKLFLNLISRISNYHRRGKDFFQKVEAIINYYLDDMKRLFSDFDIFLIFKVNIRILYFLLHEKIISINYDIYRIIFDIFGYSGMTYLSINYEFGTKIPEIKEDVDPQIISLKKSGESEKISFGLIRNDSLNQFIEFVNKNNKSVDAYGKSEYETNYVLIDKNVSFIEYAAFNGAVQIFKYLLVNKAKIMPKIWNYSIHGQNSEIIHLIEENSIKPEDDDYNLCIKEAIRCYANDIGYYLIENYSENANFLNDAIRYNNFEYISDNIELLLENINSFADNKSAYYNILYCFCEYNYANAVKILIKNPEFNINEKTIHKYFYFDTLKIHKISLYISYGIFSLFILQN
ncbi:hypothetical protein M9Y10_040581 [Tritrichomonas musculus]|uniref:DUF3447 domain-containing protein n=1 Tax=Tritrichomonas musculus TaxID=1915356 RepID=A0ABR2GQ22_9EUKA